MRVQIHLTGAPDEDKTRVVLEVWDPDHQPRPLCLWGTDVTLPVAADVGELGVMAYAREVLALTATHVGARIAESDRRRPIGF